MPTESRKCIIIFVYKNSIYSVKICRKESVVDDINKRQYKGREWFRAVVIIAVAIISGTEEYCFPAAFLFPGGQRLEVFK